ncbi:hypothetical protein LWI29_030519 [Acer saccharum]|uniref:60S ribosomal protein L7-4 n=1 Tax=Acer saccharum TaxID=4024 RepID=A0AA39V9W1_ACESA|nr:hypothetical protein LWI29_030519 [Acer saccharum]
MWHYSSGSTVHAALFTRYYSSVALFLRQHDSCSTVHMTLFILELFRHCSVVITAVVSVASLVFRIMASPHMLGLMEVPMSLELLWFPFYTQLLFVPCNLLSPLKTESLRPRAEMGEVAVVPESVLKKQKREVEWASSKKQELEAAKKKRAETCKLIFNRAKRYTKEYDEEQKELIHLKREAKLKGGFYVNPEAKLLFIVRIRGINAMHPQTRKILQLLRLRQIFNGVF